jgi:wyosine [tRNA(Phe)-imidazoG37] synthetase (radical SAM superfamily)
LPSFFEVCQKLEEKLKEMVAENQLPDVITFAGNGEPTLHPQFPEIIDVTIKLRDIYCPKARVAVLSNSSRIHVPQIFNALLKVDDNILKLDSANRQTIMLLDQPQGRFDFDETVELLKNFNGKVTIQTLFVKGSYNNIAIDNSSEEEVADWLRVISYIEPEQVMVYTIARDTPIETLEKVSSERLHQIACKVRDLGIKVQVSE